MDTTIALHPVKKDFLQGPRKIGEALLSVFDSCVIEPGVRFSQGVHIQRPSGAPRLPPWPHSIMHPCITVYLQHKCSAGVIYTQLQQCLNSASRLNKGHYISSTPTQLVSNAHVSKSENSWHDMKRLVRPRESCCYDAEVLQVLVLCSVVVSHGPLHRSPHCRSLTHTQTYITVTAAIQPSCTVEAVSNSEHEQMLS